MSRISKQQSSSDEPKKTRRQRRSEMSPEKREFLRNFVGMYDIKTAADLQARTFSETPSRICSKRK